MQKLLFAALIAAGIACAPSVGAQTAQGLVGQGPGVAAAAQTVNLTATITAIDKSKRMVTLKGPKGREVDVKVGPEVKRFDELKVGDAVSVKYAEAVMVELKKGGKATVARTQEAGGAKAQPGAAPGAVYAEKTTVVANVIAVDAATQHVTLKGPQRTVDVRVQDPEQFKLVAVGDQVEITYAEAVAVVVEPAAK